MHFLFVLTPKIAPIPCVVHSVRLYHFRLLPFPESSNTLMLIFVTPIAQLRMCVMTIVHIQGKSPNVLIVISIPLGTSLKGKNSLPEGANSFL